MNSIGAKFVVSAVVATMGLTVMASEVEIAAPALEKLPLGSVRPERWLRTQLELQRDGLTGHAEELYEDIGRSAWLTGGEGDGWERGPYYAKGLVALALVLDDAPLKAKAKRWVDALIASQRENGDFGPKADNWWANMIAIHFLRDWGEATGDPRIDAFLAKYFGYQLQRLEEHPLIADSFWAKARAGDELEVVLDFYRCTRAPALVRLARLLVAQAADWSGYYAFGGDGGWDDNGYRQHIVNFMQGLKLPALKCLVRGGAKDREAELDRQAYRHAVGPQGWAMRMHGRVDRMLNGSEPLAGRSASQGTELCAVAERILSCQEVVAAIGDLRAADDLEIVAYNTLPSTLGDDGRGMRYYQLLNQPIAEGARKLSYENNEKGTSAVPGPDSGYGCCRSNFHFAWPKFVQSMWMRKDGGLAAVAYGPSVVTDAPGGCEVTIRMLTDYPFGDSVTLRIENGGGRFPIFARIPGWDASPDAGSFRRFEREWKAGDEIKLAFAPRVEFERGIYDAVALRRGALVYALKIEAEVRTVEPEKGRAGFPMREYLPKSPWNYALTLGASKPEFVPPADLSGNVFAHGRVPCALKARGFRTTYGCWGTMRPKYHFNACANEPPPSPIIRTDTDGAEETLTLVPLGATQIRITLFPWAHSDPAMRNGSWAGL